MLDGSYFFECQCCTDEHTLRFTLDKDEDENTPCIYTSVFLQHEYSFFKRVWYAISYVFGGTRHKYGHFDCFLMKPEDAVQFQAMLSTFLNGDDSVLLRDFYDEVIMLTLKHDTEEGGVDGCESVAVVYCDNLGAALAKVDTDWYKE